MRSVIALFFVTISLQILSDAADTAVAPIGFETVRREHHGRLNYTNIHIAPSGRVIAALGRSQPSEPDGKGETAWLFYEYSEPEDGWLDPLAWIIETTEDSLRIWQAGADGHEVFCAPDGFGTGLALIDHQVVSLPGKGPRKEPALDSTGRLYQEYWGRWRSLALIQEVERVTTLPDVVVQGLEEIRQKSAPFQDAEEAEAKEFYLLDIAPSHLELLWTREATQDLVHYLNLETGTTNEIWPHNNRHKYFGGGCSAQFSPDGKYVLVLFAYDPDGNYLDVAGCIQVFTKEGEYITELFAYDGSKSFDWGIARWLPKNWIIYTTPADLVFVKVVRKPAGQPAQTPGNE